MCCVLWLNEISVKLSDNVLEENSTFSVLTKKEKEKKDIFLTKCSTEDKVLQVWNNKFETCIDMFRQLNEGNI